MTYNWVVFINDKPADFNVTAGRIHSAARYAVDRYFHWNRDKQFVPREKIKFRLVRLGRNR